MFCIKTVKSGAAAITLRGFAVNIEDKVRETLESGVEPVTLVYDPVYNCGMQDITGYRTRLVINSITLGELGPEAYSITAEQSERASRIAQLTFRLALRKINEFADNGTKFEFISCPCPATLLLNGDLPEQLTGLFGGDKKKLGKLCIEFPASILYNDPADFREKLLDLQVIGARTLISGFGSEFCPVLRLAMFPFNFVMLDPEQTSFMQDPERHQTAEAVVEYINGLHAQAIACGIADHESSAPWYKCNAFGYTLAGETLKLQFEEDGEEVT